MVYSTTRTMVAFLEPLFDANAVEGVMTNLGLHHGFVEIGGKTNGTTVVLLVAAALCSCSSSSSSTCHVVIFIISISISRQTARLRCFLLFTAGVGSRRTVRLEHGINVCVTTGLFQGMNRVVGKIIIISSRSLGQTKKEVVHYCFGSIQYARSPLEHNTLGAGWFRGDSVFFLTKINGVLSMYTQEENRHVPNRELLGYYYVSVAPSRLITTIKLYKCF